MTRFPMIFWGPMNGPGAVKEKRKAAPLRDIESLSATQPSDLIFLCGLDPDGCLAADQSRIRTKTI